MWDLLLLFCFFCLFFLHLLSLGCLKLWPDEFPELNSQPFLTSSSYFQDQLIGDSALRMYAAALSENSVTITPSVPKREIPGKGTDVKKSDAAVIATKKAPTPAAASASTTAPASGKAEKPLSQASELSKLFNSLAAVTTTSSVPQQQQQGEVLSALCHLAQRGLWSWCGCQISLT